MYLCRMLACLALAAGGCRFGGGPVIAYSPRAGVRVGLDATGGFGALRGSVGGTLAVSGDGPTRSYAAFAPGFSPSTFSNDKASPWHRVSPTFGGMIGIASGDGEGEGHVAAGAWAGVAYGEQCRDPELAHPISIVIGVRWLAGVEELFVASKFSVRFACNFFGGT